MVYNNLGRYREALAAFDRVQRLNPGFLPVKTRLAVVFHNEERYDSAEAELEKVVAANPHWADMRYHLGLVYASQGRIEEGLDQLEEGPGDQPGLSQSPDQPGAPAGPGRTLRRGGAGPWTGWPGNGPDSPTSTTTWGSSGPPGETWKGLWTGFRESLAQNPRFHRSILAQGVALGALGRAEKSAAKLEEACAADPANAETSFVLGHLRRLEGSRHPEDYRELLRDFWQRTVGELVRRVEIVPDFSDIVNIFSPTRDRSLYLSLIRICRQTLADNPRFADVHEGLGVLHSKLGEYREAVRSLQEALRLNPPDMSGPGSTSTVTCWPWSGTTRPWSRSRA